MVRFACRRADQCPRCGCHKGWFFGVQGFGVRASGHDVRCAIRSEYQDSEESDGSFADFLRAPAFGRGLREAQNVFRSDDRAIVSPAFPVKEIDGHDNSKLLEPPHDEQPLFAGTESQKQLPVEQETDGHHSGVHQHSSVASRVLQVVAVSGEVVLSEDTAKFPKVGELRQALMLDDSSEVQLLLGAEVLTDDRLLAEMETDSETLLITLVRTRKKLQVAVRIGNLKGEGSAFGIDGQPITLRMFWTFQEQARIVIPGIDGESSLRELLIPLAEELQSLILPGQMRHGVLAVREAVAANAISRLSRYIRFIQKSDARGSMQLGRGAPWNDLGLIGLSELDSYSVAELEDVSGNGVKRINAVLVPEAPAERNQKESKDCKAM
mmetsp:Transcript_102957/g.188916  ORF Transcript_102957/g.188916 Transcript_102957/m.188916 type:complete len:381 (-) Transcript_102957:65-1207(-)